MEKKNWGGLMRMFMVAPDGTKREVFYRKLKLNEPIQGGDIWFDHQEQTWKQTARHGLLVCRNALSVLSYHRLVIN